MKRNTGPNINLAFNSCCNIDASTSSNIDIDAFSGNAAMYDVEVDVTINPLSPTSGPDYNNLRNKPSINGTTIQGDQLGSHYDLATIYYNTTSGWEAQSELVSLIDCIYIYTDYKTINNQTIFGIKLGDGVTLLKDIPFTDYGTDYSVLINKPQINNVELNGNKTLADLGIIYNNIWYTNQVQSNGIVEISDLNGKNNANIEVGDYILGPNISVGSGKIDTVYRITEVQADIVLTSQVCNFENENIYFSFTVDNISSAHTVTPAEGITINKIYEAYQNGLTIFAKISYVDEVEDSILLLSEISENYVGFAGGCYEDEYWISIYGQVVESNDYWHATFEQYLNQEDLSEYRTAANQDIIDNTIMSAVNEKYTLPSAGIPSSDFEAAVQSLLDLAGTALQSAPVTSVNGQTGDVTLTIPSKPVDIGADVEVYIVNITENDGVYTADKTQAKIITNAVSKKTRAIAILNNVIYQFVGNDRTHYVYFVAQLGTTFSIISIDDNNVITVSNAEYYSLPSTGIPKIDLEISVQSSLNAANNAIPSPTNPSEGNVLIYGSNGWEAGESISGLPSGGTTGQVLAKSSNDDFAVDWRTVLDGTQIWWTSHTITPPPLSIISISNITGGTGSPKSRDYLIGPVANFSSQEPTYLYSIAEIIDGLASLTAIGSIKGTDGVGVPSGGSTGQVLKKKSSTDYDTEWANESGGISDYSDLTNKPQINNVTLSGNKSLSDLGIEPEAFVVTITNSGGSYSADKTYAQITAAASAGKRVVATIDDVYFSYYGLVNGADALFYNTKQLTGSFWSISSSNVLTHYTSTAGTYSKPVSGIPKTDLASAVRTSLDKADTALQSYTETDPTVPSWAKESNKPSYNFSEIGATPSTISGYGITDAYTKSQVDGLVSGVFHYKGVKATVSELPTTDNVVGDVWHVTTDGGEYAWDGSVWQELGTVVDLSNYVQTSRTINGKALSSDVTLDASDVGAYAKPSGGIPKTDLASAVQTSLDKADTALQSANEIAWMTYGTSTDAEIQAALNAGKLPCVMYNNFALVYNLYDQNVGYMFFAPAGGGVRYAYCQNNTWGYWHNEWPSTASDVGAIPSPASPSAGQELVYLNGAWVAADKVYIVNCTPTALDYSGTMDHTVAEIYAASQAGKTIVFRIIAGADIYYDVVATQKRVETDYTYPLFTAYFVYEAGDKLVVIFIPLTNDGTLATYSTYIYPLSTSACIPAPAQSSTGDLLQYDGSSWVAASISIPSNASDIGAYTKPSTGIPSSDFDTDVQNKLSNAIYVNSDYAVRANEVMIYASDYYGEKTFFTVPEVDLVRPIIFYIESDSSNNIIIDQNIDSITSNYTNHATLWWLVDESYNFIGAMIPIDFDQSTGKLTLSMTENSSIYTAILYPSNDSMVGTISSISVPSNASDIGAIADPISVSNGDFLVYSSNGWVAESVSIPSKPVDIGADVEVYIVNITENSGVYTTDKTQAKIITNAISKKTRTIAILDNTIYQFIGHDRTQYVYFAAQIDSILRVITIDSNNQITVEDREYYSKPSTGIPSSDFEIAVQSLLEKADTALQSAPVTSVNGQTGAVSLSIPSNASDIGAVSIAQGSAHAGEFVVVGSDGNITTIALSSWQGGTYGS